MPVTAATRSPSRADVRSLWYTRCPVPTASSVAITGGWLDREFEPDQITVSSLGESQDASLRLAHYTHQHPALFREGGVVPPLWASAVSGANRLIGLARVDQFQGLLALRDSKLGHGAELRGATIALPARVGQPIDFSRAVSWHGIEAVLAAAGLGPADVSLTDVPWTEPFLSNEAGASRASLYTARENVRFYTAEVLALVRGEVDAIYASGPHALSMAALIDAVPVPRPDAQDAPLPGIEGSPDRPDEPGHLRILTASALLAQDRPDLVTRYVTALLRASDWAARNADSAWRTVAAEVGVAEEWAHAAYASDLVASLEPGISDNLLDALAARADFLYRRRLIPSQVDVRSWLDPEPLRQALTVHAQESEDRS